MTRALGLRVDLIAQPLDGSRLLLHGERTSFLLEGRIHLAIVPLLDGTRGCDDIVRELARAFPAEEVYFALDRLEARGYVDEVAAELRPTAAAFWQGLGGRPRQVADRCRETRLACVDVTRDRHGGALAELLQANGLPTATAPEGADLVVALADDYLDGTVRSLGEELDGAGRSWLLVKPVGQLIWLGPFFGPASQRTYADLRWSLAEARGAFRLVEGPLDPLPLGFLASTRAMGLALVATEISKAVGLAQLARFEDRITTLDVGTLEVAHHRLRRRPAERSDVTLEPAPLPLQPRAKRHLADGGHRACSPAETFERLEPLISPLCGIVPRLERAGTPAPGCIYTAKVSRPAASGRVGPIAPPRVAYGKGASEIQTKVSCLAEAIERYGSTYRGDERRRRGTLERLGGDAVHPDAVQNFSCAQFENRASWNARFSAGHHVPRPFEEDAAIDWTPAWSLTHDQPRWLPTAFSYLGDFTSAGHEFFWATSNGCASGNNLEEAVLQGLLELVERDATALWWYNRLRRPALDLESFGEPFFASMLRHHQRLGRRLHVLDLTTDLGIPVAVAVSIREDGTRIQFGLGCHLDARLAVSRALTEANQPLAFEEGPLPAVADAPLNSILRERWTWLVEQRQEDHPHVLPGDAAPRRASDFERLHTDDLLEDVRVCDSLLGRCGLELVVQDLTRPDVDFPTVRVTVPGLRHIWTRFGPGRLYETPVAMGWMSAPVAEGELNPIPWSS